MMTDEAIGALDLFLDNAVLGKLNEVRIIHGRAPARCARQCGEHLPRSHMSSPSAPAATAKARMV